MNHARLTQQANTAISNQSLNVQKVQSEADNRLLSGAASVTAAPQPLQNPTLGLTVDIEA